MEKRVYTFSDVKNAGIMLEPLACRHCTDIGHMAIMSSDSAVCERCGHYDEDELNGYISHQTPDHNEYMYQTHKGHRVVSYPYGGDTSRTDALNTAVGNLRIVKRG